MNIVLATTFNELIWSKKSGNASFNNMYNNFQVANNLQSINAGCPLIGIGYYKGNNKNINYNYIKILGVSQPEENKYVVSYEYYKKSNIRSIDLEICLPGGGRYLFSIFQDNVIENILTTLNETIPKLENYQSSDSGLITEPAPIREQTLTYDYLGDYYLKLLGSTLSNDDFEKRVYQLLVSLGFHTTQKGYKTIGEYPDGIAKLENTILVYDCKNTDNFILDATEKRKMDSYVRDEATVNQSARIKPVFIARKFNSNANRVGYFSYSIDSLLYLLYKKLLKGPDFNLANILRSIERNADLNKNIIDNDF